MTDKPTRIQIRAITAELVSPGRLVIFISWVDKAFLTALAFGIGFIVWLVTEFLLRPLVAPPELLEISSLITIVIFIYGLYALIKNFFFLYEEQIIFDSILGIVYKRNTLFHLLPMFSRFPQIDMRQIEMVTVVQSTVLVKLRNDQGFVLPWVTYFTLEERRYAIALAVAIKSISKGELPRFFEIPTLSAQALRMTL